MQHHPSATRVLEHRRPPLKASAGVVVDGHGRKECLQATIKWGENFPEEPCEDCERCKKENDDGSCAEPCDEGKLLWAPSKRLLGELIPNFNLTDPKLYSEDCLFLDVWMFWMRDERYRFLSGYMVAPMSSVASPSTSQEGLWIVPRKPFEVALSLWR